MCRQPHPWESSPPALSGGAVLWLLAPASVVVSPPALASTAVVPALLVMVSVVSPLLVAVPAVSPALLVTVSAVPPVLLAMPLDVESGTGPESLPLVLVSLVLVSLVPVSLVVLSEPSVPAVELTPCARPSKGWGVERFHLESGLRG